ncbi:hypothetical protein AVEN_207804-1 [Araneus ventricosus]|uniref:Integrase zinc-binding domain-containing protein n=1 Tax=Araneus ventricosus TaxID=182803 RepID=A0A4Y2BWK7_ARAVE|nr:hypothetical protein AVEN_207804-1 [Araneus ventricosus]
MLPKKRQSIGQVHPKTRREKVMRVCETPKQHDAHFEQSRLRMSASRAIETPEVRRDYLEEDCHRRAASRANEITEQREACVKENRVIRPYIPKQQISSVCDLHDLAHPGVRATVRLICSRFVWPKMKQALLILQDLACFKIENLSPCALTLGSSKCQNSDSFIYHMIEGPLHSSQRYSYCLTAIDRFFDGLRLCHFDIQGKQWLSSV